MTERLFAPASMATLICLTTAAVAADSPGTVNADQGWSAVSRCAQEDTERGRHTCIDRVLRDAGLLTNEMRAIQQRRVFGLDEKAARVTPPAPAASPPTTAATPQATTAATAQASPPARTAPAAAATPGAATASTPSPVAKSLAAAPASSSPAAATGAPAESSEPDRLNVELIKVEKAVNGRIFVTTNDGAVWLQTESVSMPLPPAVGDRMSIRKGALGGYRCTVASTNLTYRCIRNR
jgi:hypothetical protein